MITPRNYAGTRDIIGSDAIAKSTVIGKIRRVVERHGFEPLETPGLELEETLTGKTGGDTGMNIYTFDSKPDAEGKSDRLGLRFDLTVPLARVVAQHAALPMPYRRYEIGMVYRHDQPSIAQRRYRGFTQFDADIIGTTSVMADTEVMALNCNVMLELGLKGVQPRINNRKIANGLVSYLGIPSERVVDIVRAIDKLDKVSIDEVEQELRRTIYEDVMVPGRGILNQPVGEFLNKEQWERLKRFLCFEGSGFELLALLETEFTSPVAQEGIDEVRTILKTLPSLVWGDVNCVYDFNLARGLDYYSGPIFETRVEGVVSSVGGGGRFDNLAGVFGAVDRPGTGTSFGVDRLTYVMQEQGLLPEVTTNTQVLVVIFDELCREASLSALRDLRQAGVNAELSLISGRMGEQLAYANRKGIPVAIIIGPDELASGQVTVRKLTQETLQTQDRGEILAKGRKKQQTVNRSEMLETVAGSLA